MNLLFILSIMATFCFIIGFVFSPLINMKPEKSNYKKDDTSIKKFFLNKQKRELELDFDIGNIDINKYQEEKENLKIQISELNKLK